MSLPDEKYRSINNAREFLRSLLDPKQTPRVPKKVRKEAYWALRHYIADYELEQLAKKCPDILKKDR
jgi:hypothetical protein